MRTFSLLMALAALACVIALLSPRSFPPPPNQAKWDKNVTVTGSRSTEPGRPGWKVSVAVKGTAKDNAPDTKPAEPLPQQEVAQAEPEVAPKVVLPPPEVPIGGKGVPGARVLDISDLKGAAWRVTGDYQTSLEDARHMAFTLAQTTIYHHLRTQEPPVQWVPPLSYVYKWLVKLPRTETTDFGGSVGVMYRVTLEVQLTPEAWKEIAQREREARAEGRMLWLAKLLAAVVVLLAAVTGYLRLDDLTKGYLTHWLRAAAVFVGVVALFCLMLLA